MPMAECWCFAERGVYLMLYLILLLLDWNVVGSVNQYICPVVSAIPQAEQERHKHTKYISTPTPTYFFSIILSYSFNI